MAPRPSPMVRPSAGGPRDRGSSPAGRDLASGLAGSRPRREGLATRSARGLGGRRCAGSGGCGAGRRTSGRGFFRGGRRGTGLRGPSGRGPRDGSLGGDLLRASGGGTSSRRGHPCLLLLLHRLGRPLRARADARRGAASSSTGDFCAPFARRTSVRSSRRFAACGGTARLRSGPLLRLVSYGHSACLLWRD